MSFLELNLSDTILRSVKDEGYDVATPIQSEAIPPILAGQDLLGCAQTGTGKTAAFALPTLQRLQAAGPPNGKRVIRALILAPTRELACQIGDSFRAYGRHTKLRHTVVYGGVGQGPQVRALQQGVDTVIATPGRLLDLMNQRFVNLANVEILILDEADQMLDMGFIHDLRRIVAKVPPTRQTLLFSATMPAEIRKLASEWLRDPVEVNVTPPGSTVDKVKQSVYYIEQKSKPALLVNYLTEQQAGRTLVFTRTKHGADKLVKSLEKAGVKAEAIHGNKTQNARQKAITRFKSQRPPVLVATDIASRGLDIDNVSHVINFDLPMTPEIYVHRIGRTGRAGAEGIAAMFCAHDERSMLREIQKLTRQTIDVVKHEIPGSHPSPVEAKPSHGSGGGGQRRFGARSGGGGKPSFSGKPAFGNKPSGGGGNRPKKWKPKNRRFATAARD